MSDDKKRLEELNKAIGLAEREGNKARERGDNKVAEDYAESEGKWRGERSDVLKRLGRSA